MSPADIKGQKPMWESRVKNPLLALSADFTPDFEIVEPKKASVE
jgi:hypothetical protein